ncbi:hypothetical protein C3L33_17357, partial [Rhododendron williamsianum]
MPKSRTFIQYLLKPFKSKKGGSDDLEKIAAQEQKQFPFETLVSATKNFHPNQKLGEGGFGPVFKGKLEDGREIAVKKLSQSSRQGKKEFMNEAKLLARVQHRNVVNLLGYCAHGAEKLLVYEYVANESLDKLLFSKSSSPLILLNMDFERSLCLIGAEIEIKIKCCFLKTMFNSQLSLWMQAYNHFKKGKSLDVMDPRLASSAVPDQVAMCLQIGLLCVQLDPQVRPTMRRVVVMLSKKPGSIEVPTRPGYPGARRRRSSRPATSSSLTGTSSESSSQAFGSTTNNNSASATASSSTSYLRSPRLDPHGKRPMQ